MKFVISSVVNFGKLFFLFWPVLAASYPLVHLTKTKTKTYHYDQRRIAYGVLGCVVCVKK